MVLKLLTVFNSTILRLNLNHVSRGNLNGYITQGDLPSFLTKFNAVSNVTSPSFADVHIDEVDSGEFINGHKADIHAEFIRG